MDNPKDIAAKDENRAPLDYLEPAAEKAIAHVMKLGATKYGRRNFTVADVGLGTYLAAMKRHIDAVIEGEWTDPESGVAHLAHVGANVHVVLGAQAYDKLVMNIEPEAKQTGLDPRQYNAATEKTSYMPTDTELREAHLRFLAEQDA